MEWEAGSICLGELKYSVILKYNFISLLSYQFAYRSIFLAGELLQRLKGHLDTIEYISLVPGGHQVYTFNPTLFSCFSVQSDLP